MAEKETKVPNGNAAGAALNASVVKSTEEATTRAYERAFNATDTSAPPPSAAPEPTGTK